VSQAAQIGSEHFPQIHTASERYCSKYAPRYIEQNAGLPRCVAAAASLKVGLGHDLTIETAGVPSNGQTEEAAIDQKGVGSSTCKTTEDHLRTAISVLPPRADLLAFGTFIASRPGRCRKADEDQHGAAAIANVCSTPDGPMDPDTLGPIVLNALPKMLTKFIGGGLD
jgi:hypothetical protein